MSERGHTVLEMQFVVGAASVSCHVEAAGGATGWREAPSPGVHRVDSGARSPSTSSAVEPPVTGCEASSSHSMPVTASARRSTGARIVVASVLGAVPLSGLQHVTARASKELNARHRRLSRFSRGDGTGERLTGLLHGPSRVSERRPQCAPLERGAQRLLGLREPPPRVLLIVVSVGRSGRCGLDRPGPSKSI